MKRIMCVFVSALILFGACGPKPAYKTSKGKKKLRYYNDIQFGRNAHPEKKF